MKLTGTFTGESIEEAKQKAADKFNVPMNQIIFEVVNDVKKGLFGRIKEEAKVIAGVYKNEEDEKENTAYESSVSLKEESIARSDEQSECCIKYLKNILDKMDIDAQINIKLNENSYYIDIDSKGSGAVIGRRGETLDALQYLTSLVVNKFEGDYKRVTLDSCGYREKREETLVNLANKIGQKALKTGKTTTLEPMNPYERRIIHSTIAKIDGVNSRSVGEEPYRKVVISSDNPRRNERRNGGGYKRKKSDGPRSLDLKTSFEKDYQKPMPEDDINVGVYGKIEI